MVQVPVAEQSHWGAAAAEVTAPVIVVSPSKSTVIKFVGVEDVTRTTKSFTSSAVVGVNV